MVKIKTMHLVDSNNIYGKSQVAHRSINGGSPKVVRNSQEIVKTK